MQTKKQKNNNNEPNTTNKKTKNNNNKPNSGRRTYKMSTSQKSEDDITKSQHSRFFSNNQLDPIKTVEFFADHFEY